MRRLAPLLTYIFVAGSVKLCRSALSRTCVSPNGIIGFRSHFLKRELGLCRLSYPSRPGGACRCLMDSRNGAAVWCFGGTFLFRLSEQEQWRTLGWLMPDLRTCCRTSPASDGGWTLALIDSLGYKDRVTRYVSLFYGQLGREWFEMVGPRVLHYDPQSKVLLVQDRLRDEVRAYGPQGRCPEVEAAWKAAMEV